MSLPMMGGATLESPQAILPTLTDFMPTGGLKAAPAAPPPQSAPEPQRRPVQEKTVPKVRGPSSPPKREHESGPKVHDDHGGLKPEREPEAQAAPPLPPPAPTTMLNLSTGWMNKIYFRGLDVLDRVSPDNANSGASNSVILLNRGDWEAGLQYIQALDQQLPDGALSDQDPNAVDKQGRRTSRNESFRIPSRERYAEVDTWIKYNHDLIAKKLNGSLGIAHYQFDDKRFWGISDATELQAGLSWNDFKYVVPSATYAWDFNGFNGSYLEFSLAGRTLPVWKSGDVAVGFQPYARVAYDLKYNGDNNGWNNAEIGFSVPIRLNKYLQLNLTGNYSKDLGDHTATGRNRTDDGFWGGISISTNTSFNNFATPAGVDYGKGKGPMIQQINPPGPWAVRAGMGTRTLSADFAERGMILVPALAVVDREPDAGTLANGHDNLNYKDGSIKPHGTADLGGTAHYTGGASSGTLADKDQQVLFTSDRYSYAGRDYAHGYNSEDKDNVIYPYIGFSYELPFGKTLGHFSIGAQYSFAHGEFDSGIKLSGLSFADETYAKHLFLYDLNSFSNDNTLIYDTQPRIDIFDQRDPQQGVQVVKTEKAKVATFIQSKLDVDLHSLWIPLEYTKDLGPRAHFSFSAGPTLNFFDVSLTSTAYARELDNLKGGNGLTNDVNFKVHKGLLSNDFLEPASGGKGKGTTNGTLVVGTTSGGATATANSNRNNAPNVPVAASSNPSTAASQTGVKGGNSLAPTLPGRDVGSQTWNRDEQHFELGAAVQASLKWDLDEASRWYIEIWGRYDYVSQFSISTPVSSSNIDVSSWGIGAGVGHRF